MLSLATPVNAYVFLNVFNDCSPVLHYFNRGEQQFVLYTACYMRSYLSSFCLNLRLMFCLFCGLMSGFTPILGIVNVFFLVMYRFDMSSHRQERRENVVYLAHRGSIIRPDMLYWV